MKHAAILAILAASVTVQARQQNRETLTVYLQNGAGISGDTRIRATMLASSMFASIGVDSDWRNGEPSTSTCKQAVAINIVAHAEVSASPTALAYAEPYEGVHIVVFWDRINRASIPTELLAHVMVHEITHILQGIARHSDEGIMKARWTNEDRAAMKAKPLRFTADDVELIATGMNARAAHKTQPADPGATTLAATTAAIEVASR